MTSALWRQRWPIWQYVVETRAHCFSLRMGLRSLDQPLSEQSRRHFRVWDTHPRDIQDTVFGQRLHPRQRQQGWKTRLLRQWGGGRVQLTCYILEYHETNSREYHQCCPRSRSVTYSIILLYRDTFLYRVSTIVLALREVNSSVLCMGTMAGGGHALVWARQDRATATTLSVFLPPVNHMCG